MSSLTLLLAIHLNEIADENSKAPQIPQHKIKIDMVDNTCLITWTFFPFCLYLETSEI